jgi:hypothetical protein
VEEALVHTILKGPKKRGISEGNSTLITNASSFTHTVHLVPHHKDDDELAHIKDQVSTICRSRFRSIRSHYSIRIITTILL